MQPGTQRSALRMRFDRWRLPVLAGLAAALFSVLVSQALAMREREQFSLLVETSARRVRAEIRAELDGRMHALSILAREWQDRMLPRRGEWESDVRLVLSQSPGLQSIAWLDASGDHSWAYPPDAEQPAIDLAQLRGQGIQRRSVIVGPVMPRDGKPRLRILAPLVENGKATGWLAATYDGRELFREILAAVDKTFAVEITAGGVDLYRAPKAQGVAPRPISHTELTLPGDLTIQIGVEPSAEISAATRSRLPLAILGGGVALSVLMTIALFLRNVASDRAGALELEVAGHERAEAEVRRLNAELEERVQQRTAQLERTNGDLQRFASFLSHELRQPLGTQMIWIELLESQAGDALGDAARRNLTNIRAMALKMSELITAQIALAAKPEAKAATERVDLASVVSDAIGEIAHRLEEIGAKVKVGPLPLVRGDARQLTQLFRNLVENAIKYRRDDVQCEMAIEVQPISDERGGIDITVADNGRGFAAEDAERIFEPLERLGAVGAEGQGLGLTLCRAIVERHGGSLRADGRPGVGATFFISFPEERIYR